jgi:hypothetical protein
VLSHRPTLRTQPKKPTASEGTLAAKIKCQDFQKNSDGNGLAVPGSASTAFTVTQLLPPEGDDFQCKIKHATDPHERVAKESQLSRAA